jgi:hypothetical protein
MRMQSRARYLAFAASVRKLTDSLIAVAERDERAPDLEVRLKQVLTSLEHIDKPTPVKSLKDRGPFDRYENVITLNEIWKKTADKNDLIEKLNSILSAQTKRKRRDSALKAIRFFDALESRALYHYNHPPNAKRLAVAR